MTDHVGSTPIRRDIIPVNNVWGDTIHSDKRHSREDRYKSSQKPLSGQEFVTTTHFLLGSYVGALKSLCGFNFYAKV